MYVCIISDMTGRWVTLSIFYCKTLSWNFGAFSVSGLNRSFLWFICRLFHFFLGWSSSLVSCWAQTFHQVSSLCFGPKWNEWCWYCITVHYYSYILISLPMTFNIMIICWSFLGVVFSSDIECFVPCGVCYFCLC